MQPPPHPGFAPRGDIQHVRTDRSATAACMAPPGLQSASLATATPCLSHRRLLVPITDKA